MERNIKELIISLSIILYTLIYNKIITNNTYMIINLIFLTTISFICYLMFGLKNNKNNIIKKKSIYVIVIGLLLYYFLIFSLGILQGYSKTNYSLKYIIETVFYITILYVFINYVRYTLINNCKDNKLILTIVNISFILLEYVITFNYIYYYNKTSLFAIVTTCILPLTIKNVLLTAICKNYDNKLPIIYDLIFILGLTILPVYPNVSSYLFSIISIFIPAFIYVIINRIMDNYYKKTTNKIITLKDIIYIIVVIIITILISGISKYQIIGIATGSMEPTIKVGDGVIIDKNYSIEKLKVNDIIAYQDDNRIIVHRIVEISDGQIITKGDVNNTNDLIVITEDNYIGKEINIIRGIAKPTIWIQNKLK